MTSFNKSHFLDAAFVVVSKSPHIKGSDWGRASDAVSDAYDAVHPKSRPVTRAEIDIRIESFTLAAEENFTALTDSPAQAAELVEEIRLEIAKIVSRQPEPTV